MSQLMKQENLLKILEHQSALFGPENFCYKETYLKKTLRTRLKLSF